MKNQMLLATNKEYICRKVFILLEKPVPSPFSALSHNTRHIVQ